MTNLSTEESPETKRVFIIEVDGVEHIWDRSTVTAEEIMMEAEIKVEEGMVELLPDGTQRTVAITEVFEIEELIRLKKRPRFKRG
jgi:hypothetical protein